MAGTGASAAFQTLVTQASISLANNRGNIGKTLKDLGSSRSVRALVTAAGTAGLTYGLSEAVGVSAAGTSVGDHLQKSAIQTGVSTGFNIITQDQDLDEALLQGAINIAASTAGGLGANTIGDWRAEGSIDALTHKALHAGLGAGLGAASSLLDDPGKGALGGAIGGFFAELVAENLPGSMEPQRRADAARAAATVIAVAAGQDGNAALLAATNSLMNNNLGHYSPDSEIAEQEMDGDGRILGDIAEALLGAHTVEGMVKDAEKFIDITIKDIQNFGEEGRALGESLADLLNVGGPLKEGLERGGKSIGLGVGLGLNGVGLLRGKAGQGNPGAKPRPKALKQTPGTSPTAPGSTSTPKPSVASSSVAGPVKTTPVPAPKPTSSMKKPATSYGKTSTAKPTGSTNLSALDLAAPKKALAPKASVRSPAASSVKPSPEPSVKPAVKPAPTADVPTKSILRTASSSKKPSTSYGKSPSRPTCSSSSRSPQAPSTAPPSSSSSGVKSSSPVGSTRPSEAKIQRLSAPEGIPNAGGRIRSFVTTKDEVYYRVYSNRPQGEFLTKVPPKSQALAKEGLALPPSNKATYIQEVHVPAGTRLQRSRALPVSSWDKRGSMEQFFLIDDIPPTSFKEGKVFQ
ncbi:MAG: DUF637 domain-containing protein [Alphaproteobacteria bacterium]|nr:DUF637 domain-containing protein [Alphaproteobacteria bacterium]